MKCRHDKEHFCPETEKKKEKGVFDVRSLYPITVEDKAKPDVEEKVVDPTAYMVPHLVKTPLPVGFFIFEVKTIEEE